MRTRSTLGRHRRTSRFLWVAASAILAGIPVVPMVPGTEGAYRDRYGPIAGTEGSGSVHPSPFGVFGMTVSISLPGRQIEPNAPFTVAAVVLGGATPSDRFLWNDTLGTTGTNRSITLFAPSVGSVSVSVIVEDNLGDSARASATVGIGTAPSIELDSMLGATDVGLPIPLSIRVNGSFPPYSVAWAALPAGASTSSVLSGPGEIETTFSEGEPGFAWVGASVTDRLGGVAGVDAIVATIHPRPELLLASSPAEVDAGERALVTGLVAGGTPPYSWSAAASLPAANISGSSGLVGLSDPIEWSAEFAGPGQATVRFDLADAAGVLLDENTSIRVFPALVPSLAVETASASVGAPLNLSIDLVGGIAPYSYDLVISDGERTDGNVVTPGPVLWVGHPGSPGYLDVRVTVRDSIAGSATVSTTVLVGPAGIGPAPPDPPTVLPPRPNPNPSAPSSGMNGAPAFLGLGVLVLLAVIASLYLWRRHRPHPAAPDPGDGPALEILARILKDSDETESSALRVLAEEEGLTRGEVDAALRTLEERGRIAVESGPDGSEQLRWMEPRATNSTSPGKS